MTMYRRGPTPRQTLDTGDEIMTEQHHKESCDINNILMKYEKTGILDHVSKVQGQYGHFAGVPEYQEAMQLLADSNSMFESVPATIRAQFDNNPAKFRDFMVEQSNYDAIEELGIKPTWLMPPEAQEVTPPNSTPEPATPPPPPGDCPPDAS